jgi:hypothetical protein
LKDKINPKVDEQDSVELSTEDEVGASKDVSSSIILESEGSSQPKEVQDSAKETHEEPKASIGP